MKFSQLFSTSLIFIFLISSTVFGQEFSTLKDAYEQAFLIGSAVNNSVISGSDERATEIVLNHFNTITAENVMADPQFQLEEFKKFLDPYSDGLPVKVQQELTDRYSELFEIFYRKRNKIDRVTFWGVHDGMSWKNNYPVPGRTNYPLLFDRDQNPKPAYDAVLNIP